MTQEELNNIEEKAIEQFKTGKWVDKDGHKDVLGMYISESEGAKFWLQVLTDLNNRGLKDILIACTDNLKGFTDAILSIFPKTDVQLCIVQPA